MHTKIIKQTLNQTQFEWKSGICGLQNFIELIRKKSEKQVVEVFRKQISLQMKHATARLLVHYIHRILWKHPERLVTHFVAETLYYYLQSEHWILRM